ncbi:hypothetical protein PL11201_110002 [Planktothrix sp. PCC 11201]|uniref:hypothetical protein n=1 Tax=Planktothrix sp. PCC 11201 TaxID=1729650 RepID=UPI000918D46F|nr:hypothetical protein [Planktothrix sp. PCC 11201]SKB11184.1 hypothetical protein PL11201_110002 [Planktothrix sp. PCC 11201]
MADPKVNKDIPTSEPAQTTTSIESQTEQDTKGDAVAGADNDPTNFRAERTNVIAPIDSDTAVQFSVPAWFTLGLDYDATKQPTPAAFKFLVSEKDPSTRKVRLEADGGVPKKLPRFIGKKVTLGWNKVADVPAGISIDKAAVPVGTGTPATPGRSASKSKKRSIRVHSKMNTRAIQYWLLQVIPAAKQPDYFEVGGSRYPLKGMTVDLSSLKDIYKQEAATP